MVHHQFPAAGVEHFRALYSYLDVSVPPEERVSGVVSGPRMRNLHLGGTPVSATIAMVAGAVPAGSPVWRVAQVSVNSMEYEVAGTMLVLLSLDPELLGAIVEAGWLDVPLDRWQDIIKPRLDTVRRAGMLGTIRDDRVYQLRKLINVTYRRDDEADWENEKRNRCARAFPKQCVARGLNYTRVHRRICEEWITHVIGRVASRNDAGSMEWWWRRRHHHIPGGSTSHGAAARAALRTDSRMGQGDRPGKKTVAEMLDSNFWEQLPRYPAVNCARASTKYEPGGKRRALYASNDIPYFIAAYASVHVEKEMDRGVCARQGIQDWCSWASWAARFQGYHLSSDYSDYNSEHTLDDLTMLNLLRARAWLRTSARERYDKAWAHLWTAAAMQFSWVEFPDETRRIVSGLFSGSRDTMRDHCDRHYADIRVAVEDARALGYSCAPREGCIWLAGDDEDIGFDDVVQAAVYANVLAMEGHNLNPVKQLAGAAHHEFLQVMNYPGSALQRPLSAIVATLASGNWYVPTATWYDGLINGVSDNAWEACCRGMPYGLAFRLACAYLDTAMRVRVGPGVYHELEWWAYRSPGRVHPLWQVQTPAPPMTRGYPKPNARWPCNATDDWLGTVRKQLADVPERKVKLYRDALLMASHGSAFLQWRQTELRDAVLREWPRRVKRTYVLPDMTAPEPLTAAEMADILARVGPSSRPRDEMELAARLGVDPDILNLTGSWGVLAPRLRGKDWASYASVLPARRLNARVSASAWAFRSWASRTASATPVLHEDAPGLPETWIKYVYAPNGAGKSTLVRKHPDWLDLDSVSSSIAAERLSYKRYINAPVEKQLFLIKALRRAATRRQGAIVLLGNYPVQDVEKAAKALGYAFTGVDYLPGWEVCARRLKKRGPQYTDEYIAELQSRYVPWSYQVKTVQEVEEFAA